MGKKKPVKKRVEVKLMRALFGASTRLRDFHKPVLSDADLKVSEFDVLASLGNTAGMRMSDLAAHLITAPSNVTRVCKKMEKKGLVKRIRADDSDREVIASLTEQGQDLFDSLFLRVADYMTELIDQTLSSADQAVVAELLERMNSKLIEIWALEN